MGMTLTGSFLVNDFARWARAQAFLGAELDSVRHVGLLGLIVGLCLFGRGGGAFGCANQRG